MLPTRQQEQTSILKDAKKQASAARRGTQAADKRRVQFPKFKSRRKSRRFKKSNQDQAQLVKKKEQAAQHSNQLQELDERPRLPKTI
jgi:hypothetical protein